MKYPNIIENVNVLQSNITSLDTRFTPIESKVLGRERIFNNLSLENAYNTIDLYNPEVSSNTTQPTYVSGVDGFTDNSIVARAMDGQTTGQLVLGRQHISDTILGACLLEHHNGNSWANICVGHNLDGTTYCTTNVTRPSLTDSTTNIATTKWVKDCLPLNILAYGYWQKTSLLKSYNATMSETGDCIFTIIFLSPVAHSNYIVATSAEYGGAGSEIVGVYSNSTTGFFIDVKTHTGASPGQGQGTIRWIVFG